NRSHPERRIVLEQYIGAATTGLDAETGKWKKEVLDGEIEAFLVIGGNVLAGDGRVQFYTRKVTDFAFISRVKNLINEAVFNARFRRHGISPQLIGELRRWVRIDEVDLSAKDGEKQDKMVKMFTPFFFLMMMFFGTVATSQGLMMSVVEEKTSRVIEVLLASVSPFQLMAGKILGQSGIGFTLIGLYGAAAFTTASLRGLGGILDTGIAVYFVIYFILGFLLFASLLAAVGAAVNSVKEAQSLMGPLMIVLILPMMLWFNIVQEPEGTLAVVLSFVPPMTPMVMILRIAASPDLSMLQILASIVLLAVSVPVAMWASAKIFRTGILMYGKPPSPKELLRWLRSK
ncbi:MAG: ABC transporter permease, partial [Gemmatimonadota bacterium]|nr:ABC transporter permease [Gemmatimonadota bacterium]